MHKNIQKYIQDPKDFTEGKIAMEATAHYYEVLARWLEHFDYNLIICNPRQAKYLRNVIKPYFKTDPIDSLVLAKGAELGLLKGELYDKKYAQMKELLQLHKKVKRDLTAIKNQTTRLIDVIFPERCKVIRGLFGRTSLELLQCVPTPSDITELGTGKLTTILKKYSRGRFKLAEAKKLMNLAKHSVGISVPIWMYELKLLLPRILQLQDQVAEIKIKIHDFVFARFPKEINRITAIPGVGMQYSSGQKERMGRISKAGPSLLRFHLSWSALHAVKHKGALQDFYEGLVKRGVSKGKSLVAVAVKILRSCYYILRDGVDFDSSRLQQRDSHIKQAKQAKQEQLLVISPIQT